MKILKNIKKGKNSLRAINLISDLIDSEEIEVLIILLEKEEEGFMFLELKKELRDRSLIFEDIQLKELLSKLIILDYVDTYKQEEYGDIYTFYVITRKGYLYQKKRRV